MKMIFNLVPAIVLTLSCLSPACQSAPAEQQQVVVAAAAAAIDHAAIDPLSDLRPLSGTEYDDREKRQLSNVQSKLLNFLKPLPVVDVTKEEDKYGNNGDKFNRIGRSLIGGVEKISSALTSALSFPVDTAKKISRSATEMLNNIGGRLVGLQ